MPDQKMEGLVIETEVDTIEPFKYDEFGGCGLVDVRIRLLSAQEEGDVRAVLRVRVYFTDNQMTFEQITKEAVARALGACSLVAGLHKSAPDDQGLEQRWR